MKWCSWINIVSSIEIGEIWSMKRKRRRMMIERIYISQHAPNHVAMLILCSLSIFIIIFWIEMYSNPLNGSVKMVYILLTLFMFAFVFACVSTIYQMKPVPSYPIRCWRIKMRYIHINFSYWPFSTLLSYSLVYTADKT